MRDLHCEDRRPEKRKRLPGSEEEEDDEYFVRGLGNQQKYDRERSACRKPSTLKEILANRHDRYGEDEYYHSSTRHDGLATRESARHSPRPNPRSRNSPPVHPSNKQYMSNLPTPTTGTRPDYPLSPNSESSKNATDVASLKMNERKLLTISRWPVHLTSFSISFS